MRCVPPFLVKGCGIFFRFRHNCSFSILRNALSLYFLYWWKQYKPKVPSSFSSRPSSWQFENQKKVFVVVITWIVNLSHIWLLIVFRDRSFTFVFKTFNLFFEFITMFLGETFVVNNFFLLKQLCSLIQNFSIEKKFFQLCLCDTIHNSLCRVLFPIDEQTVLSFWFFEHFFFSKVISRKNIFSFFPSVSLLKVQKRQMLCQTLTYIVFGKTVLKLSSAPTLSSLSESVALYL